MERSRTAFAIAGPLSAKTGFTGRTSVAERHRQTTKVCGRPRRAIVAQAGAGSGGPPNDPDAQGGAREGILDAARDFLQSITRAAGYGDNTGDERLADLDSGKMFDDSEDEAPEVLVVGATGETGRIIVRKLLLRGYKVRVLVRNLYSSTLDTLGTGVSYEKGDLTDYESLLKSTEDVDKVICAAGTTGDQIPEEVEFQGIANLIRAFHDSRAQLFGRSEATKISLFKFSRDTDLEKWRIAALPEEEGTKPTRVAFKQTTDRVAFLGQVFSKYSGTAEIRTVPAKINLQGFSGLVLRCNGDGKSYRFVLRTAEGIKAGVEYVSSFQTRKGRWETVRLPISSFTPRDISNGMVRKDAAPINRAETRQMAIQYTKPEVSPEKDDGRFYLAVDYIKVYRTQDEPEFVLVSCASVANRNLVELDDAGLREIAKEDKTAWKHMAEKRLRNSGLSYCIVRPGMFTEQPGGNKSLVLEQSANATGVIARADLAEICVKALLDPRACNVTFEAFESMYAPSAQSPSQDMSSLLGRLTPNT